MPCLAKAGGCFRRNELKIKFIGNRADTSLPGLLHTAGRWALCKPPHKMLSMSSCLLLPRRRKLYRPIRTATKGSVFARSQAKGHRRTFTRWRQSFYLWFHFEEYSVVVFRRWKNAYNRLLKSRIARANFPFSRSWIMLQYWANSKGRNSTTMKLHFRAHPGF